MLERSAITARPERPSKSRSSRARGCVWRSTASRTDPNTAPLRLTPGTVSRNRAVVSMSLAEFLIGLPARHPLCEWPAGGKPYAASFARDRFCRSAHAGGDRTARLRSDRNLDADRKSVVEGEG